MSKFLITIIYLLVISVGSLVSAEIPEFLKNSQGEVAVILKIQDRPDNASKMFSLQQNNISKHERQRQVLRYLKNHAFDSQSSLNEFIENNSNLISDYRKFWINNTIYIKGDAGFIRILAARHDVEFIYENLPLILVEPVETRSASQSEVGAEQGLEAIGVREAWNMELNGSGRIVCNFDTGVYGDHPALFSSWRGSNGGSTSESWFDLYTSAEFPTDLNGHGTHTMGTMVGIDEADTIGVAFGAQWIAAAVVDRGGGVSRTIADILSAFQWAANPDGDQNTTDDIPDVVNNSWGIPAGFYGSCDETFWDAIDNLEALGIVCLFAAGNEGPDSSTIRTPADRITSQFNSFAVGAVDGENLDIAIFSSRGPSGCDGATIKPEITAPGIHIRSCDENGGYVTMSGTSMATPHIAGAVAILRQFNPEASVDQIKSALLAGADDLGVSGPDNDYGHGFLNILNSLYHMPPPDHPFIRTISISADDTHDSLVESGDTVSFLMTLENLGSGSDIEAVLNSQSAWVEIIENRIDLGAVDNHDTIGLYAFSAVISSDMPAGVSINFIIEYSSETWLQAYNFAISPDSQHDYDIATISTDNLEFSFSNFGQFGLGENSINSLGGAGFKYPLNGNNLLYEAALLISTDNRVSDGARDDYNQPGYDFIPLENSPPEVISPGIYSDHDGIAVYTDAGAQYPIGLEITQRCFGWDLLARFITVEFTVHNVSGADLSGIRIGLFCDWDIPVTAGQDDLAGYNDILSLGYMHDVTGDIAVGVRSITSSASSYRAIKNDEILADGFSKQEKLLFMTGEIINIDYNSPDNYSHLLSVGPLTIADGDSEVVAFAFVAGESLNDLFSQADLAFNMYPGLTSNDYTDNINPEKITLMQNYPNPFNASTTIELMSEMPSQLVIFNVTGRLVKQFDILSTGHSLVTWDGTNELGQNVVSGVYFYSLKSDGVIKSRKMIYLK